MSTTEDISKMLTQDVPWIIVLHIHLLGVFLKSSEFHAYFCTCAGNSLAQLFFADLDFQSNKQICCLAYSYFFNSATVIKVSNAELGRRDRVKFLRWKEL